MVLNTCCDVVACPIRSSAKTSTAFARPARMYDAPANTVEDPVTPPVLMRMNGCPVPIIPVRSTDASPASASGATPAITTSMSLIDMPASSSASLQAAQISSRELLSA